MTSPAPRRRILVVRLGALGDIIHTLPAVANLKLADPRCHITWLVEPRWSYLLQGNHSVDSLALLDRSGLGAIYRSARKLRQFQFDLAIDFQGLLKSAVAARVARPGRVFGFERVLLRETQAGWFYSDKVASASEHVVDRALDLAEAAGANTRYPLFFLPPGTAEARLPGEPFVLTSPLAGWGAKQWPFEYYGELAGLLRSRLGCVLVVNGPPGSEETLARIPDCYPHISGLPGLVDAARHAMAVVGVDSGPMHLAAALDAPGVAIFGPTDPERNGPYGGHMTVLRAPDAPTTYKRRSRPDPSMRSIRPEAVVEALEARLAAPAPPGAGGEADRSRR